MYYQEEVINGILCCKNTPDGDWRELSKERLTERIESLELINQQLNFVN